MLKSEIGHFLYNIGVSYYEYGVIKNGRKKVFDYYKTDKLTNEQKERILEAIPHCEFKANAIVYAPEIKRALICIPVGRINKTIKI